MDACPYPPQMDIPVQATFLQEPLALLVLLETSFSLVVPMVEAQPGRLGKQH